MHNTLSEITVELTKHFNAKIHDGKKKYTISFSNATESTGRLILVWTPLLNTDRSENYGPLLKIWNDYTY